MLYVDDSAFVFEYRDNTEKGITILSDHFTWFGLEMYIGTKTIPQSLNAYYSRLLISSMQTFYRSLTH